MMGGRCVAALASMGARLHCAAPPIQEPTLILRAFRAFSASTAVASASRRCRRIVATCTVACLTGTATLAAQPAQPGTLVRGARVVTLLSFTPDSSFPHTALPATITVRLRHRLTVAGVAGGASHYRVSRFADFRDATWLPYQPEPQLTLATADIPPKPGFPDVRQTRLYFQVRAPNALAGAPTTGATPSPRQPGFIMSQVLDRLIVVPFIGG